MASLTSRTYQRTNPPSFPTSSFRKGFCLRTLSLNQLRPKRSRLLRNLAAKVRLQKKTTLTIEESFRCSFTFRIRKKYDHKSLRDEILINVKYNVSDKRDMVGSGEYRTNFL